MRIDRLMPCVLLAFVGCSRGGSSGTPGDDDPDPKFDAPPPTPDAPDPDPDSARPDGPSSGGPTKLTNLTPVANETLRADFGAPLFFKPDGSAVAVVANFLSAGARDEPIVVPLDASGIRRLVNVTACGTCDADKLAWTADGASLYALGDLVTNNEVEVVKLDPAMTDQTPVVAGEVTGTANDVQNLFVVDAGGGVSRVWVVGNWLSVNRQAGAFASDATLPFNTNTQPPIVVPSGNAQKLFSGNGSTINVFHARGNKIAFVADLEQPNRFDLYVADAAGGSPTKLVQGQVNVEISSVLLSPDGIKVAFAMDSAALNNSVDLHMVSTAGGPSVQLSPANACAADVANCDVFFEFEWSADSKFVGFSADLEESGFDQGYVVDTTQATPVAQVVLARNEIATQTGGAQGVRGKLLFDADNNIYFRARTVAGDDNFHFFKATIGATITKTEITLPKRSDNSTSDVGAFGISPDGTKLVFSADAPAADTYDLYLLSL